MEALLAAVLGAFLGYCTSIFFMLKNQDSILINEHINTIFRIEETAIKYWSVENSTNLAAQAARLDGDMTASSFFLEDAERLLGKKFDEFKKLDGELFDLVTGESFQTASHTANYSTCTEIITKCNQIRSLLSNSRWSLFWTR